MMPVPSPEVLSLHTMTGLLQSACLAEPASRYQVLLDQAPSLLALTTPEMEANLSFDMVQTLDRLRHGHLSHTDQAMKALALLTARIGEMETARARDVEDEAASVSVRDGIDQLLAGKEFRTRPMPKAFLATMEDPRQGFEPLRTANGTDIAFFRSPEELGEPWKDMMASHWQKGVGLVVYRNQRTNTYGMVNGSRFSIYGGRIPTEWTAKGVFHGVEAIYQELGLDLAETPLLLEGYGGTEKGLGGA